MKEKLNCVKTDSSLFILHSSFCESLAFVPPNISFDRAKDHVSPPQTSPFTRRNMVFRAAKPYLLQIQILQTARLQMKNRVTICHSTTYEKPQKNALFSTGKLFVRSDGLNLGSKFEYFLTILRPAEFAIRKHRNGAVVMSTSKRTIKNCLPLNWANKKPELSQALAY